ncbi:MAG: sulfotransferase [Phycisphaerae bacterium]|jgi:hypothetical protein|nr:sulfotransferase [Phycisphaerae bacterium]
MSCLDRMIFITGFARGGTSWLRTCVAAHPDVQQIPQEMPIFRTLHSDRAALEIAVGDAMREHGLIGPWVVNKAPANAPFVAKAARTVPEAKFLFVVRDPRDVFISHKRGNQEWMRGRNSEVDGCMEKTRRYYDGFVEGASLPNLLMVRYEELHQDFHATLARVFDHIGLAFDRDLLDSIHARCNFMAMTSRHTEDRDSPNRKGVIGDWAAFLEPSERAWFEASEYWTAFMGEHGYRWEPLTYGAVLNAMHEADVASLSLDELLDARLDSQRSNLVLLHDIDLLRTPTSRASVQAIARIEGELGLAGVFNFLPLDDVRYKPLAPEQVIEMATTIRSLAPKASLGLHLNATERFFAAKAPPAGLDHPDMPKAIAYLHEQIDAYEKFGIHFRFATAHGYGRTTAIHPNNTTPVFRDELARRGIRLYDGDVREALATASASLGGRVWGLRDVGGPLTVWDAPNNGAPDHPETYRRLPPGSLVSFLIHPGNYDVNLPIPLGMRTNTADRADLGRLRWPDRQASPPPTALPPQAASGSVTRWLGQLARRVSALRNAR